MERITDHWDGCEYTALWSAGRLARYLKQKTGATEPEIDNIEGDEPQEIEVLQKPKLKRGPKPKPKPEKQTKEEKARERIDTKYVGKVFGYLHVLRFDHKGYGIRYYQCHCDKCGSDVLKSNKNLSNHIRSCGCYSGNHTVRTNQKIKKS